MEMAQQCLYRCSQCGDNGHNSRTCDGKVCFKLFGVNINIIMTEQERREALNRSASTGKFELSSNNKLIEKDALVVHDGYLSDGPVQIKRAARNIDHESKKGKPWTEEEHSAFLIGLKKYGRGSWKIISREYVPTRTTTQVASHAQKYYLRKLPPSKNKKRRSSMFDKPLKELATAQIQASNPPLPHTVEAPKNFPISPTYGVQGIPYIVGVPAGNGQRFPVGRIAPNVSLVPVMNASRPHYVYLPRAYGNFAPWMPVSSQLSGVPSPLNLSSQGTSTIETGFRNGRMASPLLLKGA